MLPVAFTNYRGMNLKVFCYLYNIQFLSISGSLHYTSLPLIIDQDLLVHNERKAPDLILQRTDKRNIVNRLYGLFESTD